MLEFAANINRIPALGGRRRKAGYAIKPFLIRTAEIIGDGLAEVSTVRQGLATDTGHPRIYRFDAGLFAGTSGENAKFGGEFFLQIGNGIAACFGSGIALDEFVGSTRQQIGTFESRPGPLSEKGSVNEAECNEPVESGIHPAVDRDKHSSSVFRRRMPFEDESIMHGTPDSAGKLQVVVTRVDVLSDKVSNQAADKNV